MTSRLVVLGVVIVVDGAAAAPSIVAVAVAVAIGVGVGALDCGEQNMRRAWVRVTTFAMEGKWKR